MTIEWNESLMSTGSFNIDTEHKEWIKRFNEFDQSVASQNNLTEIDKKLAHFANFSNTHFPHEEALMERVNCPAAAINRADHQKFREKLMQMQMLVTYTSEPGWGQLLPLKNELEKWLINHITKIDVQLRPFVEMESNPPFLPLSSEQSGSAIQNANNLGKQTGPLPSSSFAEIILRNSPDVIVIVNDQGRIVYINDRCLPLLGYAPKELVGQLVEVLVPGQFDRHKELRDKFQQNPSTRSMGHRPILSALHKSGSRIPVDISISPLSDNNGKSFFIQAVIRDALPLWNSQYELMVQSVAMNAAANGIVITDTDGVIQWINPAVTKMTGYSSTELVGNTPRILSSGKHDPAFYSSLWKTIMAGDTWTGEIINRRKDGSLYYEEQSITPVRFEDGQIKRFVAIKQDVTARRQAEMKAQEANQVLENHLEEAKRLTVLLSEANKSLEERVQDRTQELENLNIALQQANQQLKELDDLKSSFLGVISHELRTPFASITFSLQLIEKYGLNTLQPEQQSQFLQLQSNIKSAERMIENLINYATFVSKQGQLNLAPVNIRHVISVALVPSGYKANHKQITLKEEVPGNLPQVLGDGKRLSEVIYQLVDNAIKFATPGSTVTISAKLRGDYINIAVNNLGDGIPSDKLSKLFKSFAQIADPHLRSQEGLGLGLALVEYIVRAHHGEVWAESLVGLGSTFGFMLPALPAGTSENQ